jgi:PadR family transcriptional regulator, regulatory protein PadR
MIDISNSDRSTPETYRKSIGKKSRSRCCQGNSQRLADRAVTSSSQASVCVDDSCAFHLTSKYKRAHSIGMSNKDHKKADVLQGTLDLMVMQTLATLGPLHGYAIAARLEQVSSGAVRLNMGTLYPALMRLEQRGFVRGEWDVTENNRKARFYAVTAAGRRQLTRQKGEWDRTVSIMQAVLREQG